MAGFRRAGHIYTLRIVLTDHGLVPKIMHGPPTHFHLSTSVTQHTQWGAINFTMITSL